MGKPSPRTEVVYNVEPFRGAVRQGDWKLIWRSLIPPSVDPYRLASGPCEQSNRAAEHPEKVAAVQDRLNTLGRESAKPLAMICVTSVGLAHGKPLLASKDGASPVKADAHGPTITDEDSGRKDQP
jgi:hypothetical protein